MLAMAAVEIDSTEEKDRAKNSQLLKHTLAKMPAFEALALMGVDEQAKIVVQPDGRMLFDTDIYANDTTYIDTVMTEQPQLSGAIFSLLYKAPTVLTTYPMYGHDELLIGVLIAELKVSIMDELRRGIEFGKDGHFDNAVKFCNNNDEVVVSTQQLSNAVEICITDTGPGLSDKDLTLVFSKDAHLSNKPTAGEISTGTGLVICKQIVDLDGGEIGVNNTPDGGCNFWFRLS